jgi:hypothetical protein
MRLQHEGCVGRNRNRGVPLTQRAVERVNVVETRSDAGVIA